jgi:dihydrofolate reductase
MLWVRGDIMRNLKLQMNFAGINWDDDMITYCVDNLKNTDSILLGRTTAEGFIPYWKEVAEKQDPADINTRLGRPINDTPKIIFSSKLKDNVWDNTTIVKGDFKKTITALKEGKGKDIIVYGGNSFASSLVKHGLVDEYYLFVDPLAIDKEEPILKFINRDLHLKLKESKPFSCGTVLLKYVPAKRPE